MEQLIIRRATKQDAAAILAIYAPYIEKTIITFEYEIPSVEEFSERITQTLLKYPYLVAVYQDELVGYAYAGPYKGRAAYDWSVETTVYVQENCSIKGVGTALYQRLEYYLEQQGIYQLMACITEGNQKSVAFHEKFGYQMIGTFKQVGFKFEKWCDVLWMQKTLKPLPTTPEKIRLFGDISD
jgi:Sortase and related acyltransferases